MKISCVIWHDLQLHCHEKVESITKLQVTKKSISLISTIKIDITCCYGIHITGNECKIRLFSFSTQSTIHPCSFKPLCSSYSTRNLQKARSLDWTSELVYELITLIIICIESHLQAKDSRTCDSVHQYLVHGCTHQIVKASTWSHGPSGKSIGAIGR